MENRDDTVTTGGYVVALFSIIMVLFALTFGTTIYINTIQEPNDNFDIPNRILSDEKQILQLFTGINMTQLQTDMHTFANMNVTQFQADIHMLAMDVNRLVNKNNTQFKQYPNYWYHFF